MSLTPCVSMRGEDAHALLTQPVSGAGLFPDPLQPNPLQFFGVVTRLLHIPS